MKEAPSFLLQAGRGLATTKKREKGEHQPMQQLSLSLSLCECVSLLSVCLCVCDCVCVCVCLRNARMLPPHCDEPVTHSAKGKKKWKKGLYRGLVHPFPFSASNSTCKETYTHQGGALHHWSLVNQFLFFFFSLQQRHRPAHRAFWKKTISYCVSC